MWVERDEAGASGDDGGDVAAGTSETGWDEAYHGYASLREQRNAYLELAERGELEEEARHFQTEGSQAKRKRRGEEGDRRYYFFSRSPEERSRAGEAIEITQHLPHGVFVFLFFF